MSKLKAHPYADLFPMMTGAELDALAADIGESGLLQPIMLYHGNVLDGRNRLLACEKAGVEPAFAEYDGDDAGALALVISLNVQRRDLTAAQRAIVAARSLAIYEEQARERQREGGKEAGKGRPKEKGSGKSSPNLNGRRARDDASSVFKVSDKSVQQAKLLLSDAPDLAAQVEGCTLSLAAAYDSLQGRRKQAAQKARDAERVAEYKDAVSNGEMTVDDALQKAIEEEREQREKVAAEADARQRWLKEFAQCLDWVERFVARREDEELPWYTVPGSPGMFAHGVTPARIDDVIGHLARARRFTFGDAHEPSDA